MSECVLDKQSPLFKSIFLEGRTKMRKGVTSRKGVGIGVLGYAEPEGTPAKDSVRHPIPRTSERTNTRVEGQSALSVHRCKSGDTRQQRKATSNFAAGEKSINQTRDVLSAASVSAACLVSTLRKAKRSKNPINGLPVKEQSLVGLDVTRWVPLQEKGQIGWMNAGLMKKQTARLSIVRMASNALEWVTSRSTRPKNTAETTKVPFGLTAQATPVSTYLAAVTIPRTDTRGDEC